LPETSGWENGIKAALFDLRVEKEQKKAAGAWSIPRAIS